MIRKSTGMAVAVAIFGSSLALCSNVQAGTRTLTVDTAPLLPDPEGYVYCKVVATSRRPIGIVATIISDAGTEVTEFGTRFRASPNATTDGRFHAEETAGSFNDSARFCRVTVSGARRKDVHVSLTAFDGSGDAIVAVEAP